MSTLKNEGSIQTTLVSSEYGFDDYDVQGLPKVHRVCVGNGIKKGDIFNVYCEDSVKLGAEWIGSLKESLIQFAANHVQYRSLLEDYS